jgi:DNA-binding MarR family transcriptional regulator
MKAVTKVLTSHSRHGFECLCGNARMAARAVSLVYDEALKPSGLRASQLAVLWAVVALPGSTVNVLARTIAMDATTLTRNLRVLERELLVTMIAGTDRREREVHATIKGKRAFARAMPLWEAAQAKVVGTTGRDAKELNKVLLALSRAARQ